MNKGVFFIWIMFLAIGFCLSGCGKVSNLSPMEGSSYPHSYPRK